MVAMTKNCCTRVHFLLPHKRESIDIKNILAVNIQSVR